MGCGTIDWLVCLAALERVWRLTAVTSQAFELEKAWAPLSSDLPPALFPLANVPLIDYTMELLVSAGVREIFVFCGGGEHGARIKQYIRTSQW